MEWAKILLTPLFSAIFSFIFSHISTKIRFRKYELQWQTPSVLIRSCKEDSGQMTNFKNSPCYEAYINVHIEESGNSSASLKCRRISDIENYNFSEKDLFLLKIKNFSQSATLLQYLCDKRFGNLPIENNDFSLLEKDDEIVLIFAHKEKPSSIVLKFYDSKLTYTFDGINNGPIKPIITSQKKKKY